jgi:hypothetical protein
MDVGIVAAGNIDIDGKIRIGYNIDKVTLVEKPYPHYIIEIKDVNYDVNTNFLTIVTPLGPIWASAITETAAANGQGPLVVKLFSSMSFGNNGVVISIKHPFSFVTYFVPIIVTPIPTPIPPQP